jgi:hypothetical protein
MTSLHHRKKSVGEDQSHMIAGTEHPLSVVCLSLGGTKIEIGLLTRDGVFRSSPELYWRESSLFARFMNDADASRFCDALARWLSDFLAGEGYALSDARIIGIPFPGPKDGEMWYSNNLISAFRQGVPLDYEITNALSRLCDTNLAPPVRVILDAQCDAGGEIFHPAGWFSYRSGDAPPRAATVLNIATGIAAGFIDKGQVLVNDEDFKCHIDPAYDGGAGQLGRHLYYYPDLKRWEYHFWPHGQLPPIGGSAIRMTERLSGPALAARLLLQLGRRGLLNADTWTTPELSFSEIEELYALIASHDPDRDVAAATQAVRNASHPLAGAVLERADYIYQSGVPYIVASCIHTFATQIAAELAAALRAWMNAPGWSHFGRQIVLTGGAGIRFLASSDAIPGQSFLAALETALSAGSRVRRSRLLSATERECYLFLHRPLL